MRKILNDIFVKHNALIRLMKFQLIKMLTERIYYDHRVNCSMRTNQNSKLQLKKNK